ncbi:Xaa-Pro aminopeptidase [Marinospirillum sp.]|uniref:Xaa-Pro aminopeptidase n=1 Tax=Marinospirillum sp. TaxID=2183934 RepID=UPI0028706BEB|nr:Xaa-Pro aminopeptidase [Marinospirillum sp.]MDR9466902.1 Xaa-Pro aminopeptidase [Marinospirillum sp.]
MSYQPFHQRRQELLEQLPDKGLALIPAAAEVTRSRDTEYPFRQASDFWYLTGFTEPDGLLVLMKGRSEGESLIFTLPRDPAMEVWTGIRLGQEEAVPRLGVDQAFSLTTEVDEQLIELIGEASEVWLPLEDLKLYQRYLGWRQGVRSKRKRSATLPDRLVDVAAQLAEMRLIKSTDEVDLMRQAAQISADAHCRAMKACRPGMYEYQLQAELEHEFAFQGAAAPAYASIVGAGANACVLHYIANQSQMQSGDLVLIDAGAEYQGYAGDITRTFPVNGQFTPPQKQLYELVLKANQEAIKLTRPGTTLEAIHHAVLRILTQGLLDLGILSGDLEQLIEDGAFKPYFMHGTSHWLGLDVHDVGRYRLHGEARPLKPGMVLTIEPGLYFAPDRDEVDPCWRGIGIRIEDDVLVTLDGCEVLSRGVPKTVAELEALMGDEDAANT